jgi:hypothetical protein
MSSRAFLTTNITNGLNKPNITNILKIFVLRVPARVFVQFVLFVMMRIVSAISDAWFSACLIT